MRLFLNKYLPDASAPGDIEVAEGLAAGTGFFLVKGTDISGLIRPRDLFSHKGTYGHALIVAGATDTMGAALLAASGCIHAGAGLTTVSIPESGLTALNTLLPEAMFTGRDGLGEPEAFERYNAIAVGPGMKLADDVSTEDANLLQALYQLKKKPAIVIDAEALREMAVNKNMFNVMSSGNILTPHIREFDHLFGEHKTWWERIQTALDTAEQKKCVIVLKNRYTFIACPERRLLNNPTGNPAMAQGGMGDVLTGIIAGYLAQGYSVLNAAMLGCFFHGLAGDELATSQFNVTASQVAAQLPRTVRRFLKEVN